MSDKTERDPRKWELRPVDGEFKLSARQRAKWCAKNGHPLALLNLSLSAKRGYDCYMCICGKRAEERSPKDRRANL